MSLLVTGTIGIDTVETPHGKAQDVLGGSAAYFAIAASLLNLVRLVGAVGEDFPPQFRETLTGRNIDLAGLETRRGAKTFRWHGRYAGDMNSAETLRTDLNVVSEAPPNIPEAFRNSEFVFLANTHPTVQRQFREQLRAPKLVVCDTMNLWIGQFRNELLKTLAVVDGVVLNDGKARMLTGKDDLLAAGRDVLAMGPKFAVVKKGVHGAVLVTAEEFFTLPSYPTTQVKDPTGAGDTFAAGFMGHLASLGLTDMHTMKSAMARGICMASITIEDFSMASLQAASRQSFDARLAQYKSMLHFE